MGYKITQQPGRVAVLWELSGARGGLGGPAGSLTAGCKEQEEKVRTQKEVRSWIVCRALP